MGKHRATHNKDYWEQAGGFADRRVFSSLRQVFARARQDVLHPQAHKHETIAPPIARQTARGPVVGREPAHARAFGFGAIAPAADASGFAVPAAVRAPIAATANTPVDGARGSTAILQPAASLLPPRSLLRLALTPVRIGLQLGLGLTIAALRAIRRGLERSSTAPRRAPT